MTERDVASATVGLSEPVDAIADEGGSPLSERATTATTRGAEAERLVVDRLRAVLPDDVALLHHVRWMLRDHGYEREGEADVVIGDPERGILTIEVKAGEISRDANGTWWAGRPLTRSPFEQASDSRHALLRKLYELPNWPTDLKPINGQAVAFPDVELDTMRARLGLMGPDVDPDLIADQSDFLDTDDGRRELRAFIDRAFALWGGKGDTRAPGKAAIALLQATMTEPLELRSMLRNEIAGGEREVVRLTEGQFGLLNTLRYHRRAAIVGGAGTGKTLLAAEKARRLAKEGYQTLLVCFNSPLAAMLTEEVEAVARETGRLDVRTFHQLCEDLGREAGVLAARPTPVPQDWWDKTLPRALDDAAERLGARYHAIVVDEGQDFEPDWLASLDALLFAPREDVLYVFHDPAQAIYRDDAVAQLDLPTFPLETNCRNAQPIHAVVARLAEGGLAGAALRTDGRAPEFIEAADGPATVEALRKLLHRLRVEEEVPPWDIAVLTGVRLEESAVWGAPSRRYGNEVLGNPAVDDAGHHLGQAAHVDSGLAQRRDPVRHDPPLQGSRTARHRARRGSSRRRAPRATAVCRGLTGAAAPGRHRVAGRPGAAPMKRRQTWQSEEPGERRGHRPAGPTRCPARLR